MADQTQGGADQYGLCKCGCGGKTAIAVKTCAKYGRVKGKPSRFLPGHQNRGKGNRSWRGGVFTDVHGYVFVHSPGNPSADHHGYVRQHILLAEKALGKQLPPEADVHHINRIKNDNRNNNLVICQDRAYHMLLHQRQRALEKTGNADWRLCKFCGQYGDPNTMARHRSLKKPTHTGTFEHKDCKRKALREYILRRKTVTANGQ